MIIHADHIELWVSFDELDVKFKDGIDGHKTETKLEFIKFRFGYLLKPLFWLFYIYKLVKVSNTF